MTFFRILEVSWLLLFIFQALYFMFCYEGDKNRIRPVESQDLESLATSAFYSTQNPTKSGTAATSNFSGESSSQTSSDTRGMADSSQLSETLSLSQKGEKIPNS